MKNQKATFTEMLMMSGLIAVSAPLPATAQTTPSTSACEIGMTLGPDHWCDVGDYRFHVLPTHVLPTAVNIFHIESEAFCRHIGPNGGTNGACSGVYIFHDDTAVSLEPAYVGERRTPPNPSFIACRISDTHWVIESVVPTMDPAGVCRDDFTTGTLARWGLRIQPEPPAVTPATRHVGACRSGLVLGPGGSCDTMSGPFRVESDGCAVLPGEVFFCRTTPQITQSDFIAVPVLDTAWQVEAPRRR